MNTEARKTEATKNTQALRKLGGGFAVLMLLMTALVVFGMLRLNGVYEALKEIVEVEQIAVHSLYVMHGAARERAVLVHKIVQAQDPIERELLVQEFYEQASVFVDARGKLEGLKLPNEERDFIEKIRAAAKTTSPLLHEVIDLVAKGQMSGARRYLSEKALPSQEHLIQVMAQALEHEFRESRGLADSARQQRQQAFWFMAVSGAAAIMLGVLIAWFAINRTSRLVSELVRSRDELHDTYRDLQFQKEALDQHNIVSITDEAGDITYINQKFIDISGYAREELLGQNHRILRSGHHTSSFYEEMWKTISEGRVWHGVVCNRAKSGAYYWVDATIMPFLDDAGLPLQYVSIRTDISRLMEAEQTLQRGKERLEAEVSERTNELTRTNGELQSEIERRKALEEHLRSLAITDTLTGIYNRRKFDETLADEVRRSERYGAPLSLVLLDIDFFKKINDARGHQAGDTALKMLGSFIAEKIRSHDVLARYGGEEFVILAPGTGIEGCRKLAEKLRAGIEQHGFAEAGRITCSFGITEFQHGDTAESFVRRADVALYRAKKNGRNRTEEE